MKILLIFIKHVFFNCIIYLIQLYDTKKNKLSQQKK